MAGYSIMVFSSLFIARPLCGHVKKTVNKLQYFIIKQKGLEKNVFWDDDNDDKEVDSEISMLIMTSRYQKKIL